MVLPNFNGSWDKNNPIVTSVYVENFNEPIISPGSSRFLITEDGLYITTEDGRYIITEN